MDFPHTYNGDTLETFVDLRKGVCVLKAAVQEQLYAQPVLMHIVALLLLDSVQPVTVVTVV